MKLFVTLHTLRKFGSIPDTPFVTVLSIEHCFMPPSRGQPRWSARGRVDRRHLRLLSRRFPPASGSSVVTPGQGLGPTCSVILVGSDDSPPTLRIPHHHHHQPKRPAPMPISTLLGPALIPNPSVQPWTPTESKNCGSPCLSGNAQCASAPMTPWGPRMPR